LYGGCMGIVWGLYGDCMANAHLRAVNAALFLTTCSIRIPHMKDTMIETRSWLANRLLKKS
jgi:hypothetical protein